MAKADAYTVTMYIMAGLLTVGFICNLVLRRVDDRHLAVQDARAAA